MSDAVARPPAAVSWRRVVAPTEHGSWAFLGEPLLLGLLVAPSWAGALLAVAALAAFLARQPLKLAAGDRRRGRRYPRTAAAERAVMTLGALALLAAGAGLATARGPALQALALAAPLGGAALALDLSQRSREVAAELAGALALGATAAAIPLAAGWSLAPALGLWAVIGCRVIPSVLFVRARLRLDRGERAPVAAALAVQLAAVAAGGALARAGLAPWTAPAALAVLALRAAVGLSRWRPRLSVQRLGLIEVAFGLMLVIATALGVRLHA